MKKYKLLKQRLIGLALIILGILSIFIEYDATAALFFVPLGLYAMITKNRITY